MRSKIVIYGFSLICGLLIVACKKYPEGGYEKDGPKNIIGSWLLTLYEVDGIDSTNLINYNGNDDYKKFSITTPSSSSKEIHINLIGPVYTIIFGTNNETFNGEVILWGPYNGAMACFPQLNTCYKQFFTPETNKSTWKILKLDSKEMHLQSQQIHAYNFKFIKIN